MSSSDEMQRVLRDLLPPPSSDPSERPDAVDGSFQCLLFFTSDWVAPADALVQTALRDTGAARMPVVVLRHRLLNDADSSDAALDAAEKTVPADTFRALCKRFRITALPASVVVDVSSTSVDMAVHGTHRVMLYLKLCHHVLRPLADPLPQVESPLHSFSQASEQKVTIPETKLAEIRDEASSAFEGGEFLNAARRFVDVLLEKPDCVKANFNLAVILNTMGETYFAVHFMLQVVAADDNDSVAHTVLRSVYYQEEPQAVISGYEATIARFPHHVRAVHSLATLRGQATKAAPAYVKEVFDELAETFEEKLVTHLEYRVPWLLVDALKRVEPRVFSLSDGDDSHEPSQWRVADVGCGTGLCGRLLRPFVAHIVGVDISPLMIEKTRDAGSYDELQTDDIGPFLSKRDDTSLDLVVSADVWIYVGALEEIFATCSHKLKPRGWLAFSTELLLPEEEEANVDGFKLAASGRFQHSEAYIRALASANGFGVQVQEPIAVRKESGEAIPGRIYLLQKFV